MLKKRIVATLLVRDGLLVKGTRFDNWRVVGSPIQAINVYNRRDMDEIVVFFLDGIARNLPLLEQIAAHNFLPLAVGGGIQSAELAVLALSHGADKAVLTWHGDSSVPQIFEVALRLGSQSTTVVCNRLPQLDPGDMVAQAIEAGAGEIIFQCPERDGEMGGMDVQGAALLRDIPVPLVVSSGAGSPEHFGAVLDVGADAVAAGAIWHFTHYTPNEVKEWLDKKGHPMRLI